MDNTIEEDVQDENTQEFFINFSPEVQKAIEEVLPSKDPLDEPDFNSIDYINSLFPTEQSLSNIDEVVVKMENKISSIDNEISTVIRGQILASQDGRKALDEAQKVIKHLFLHIIDIKERAEKSEEMVREITRDIKQLDCAKKNLTLAITTLNHLHMLVGGVDSLKLLTKKRLYGEIALPLQAISEVMKHFENYSDIEQIKSLSDQVKSINVELAEQITLDFKEAFNNSTKQLIGNKQLAQACLVISILEPKVKNDLLKWFINLQLQEYLHLFNETEDTSWLDKIDKRYSWIKRHLLEFEERLSNIFPQNWEVSERIVVEFCKITHDELTKIMSKRRNEIDVKLLLYAIQKTNSFESLLTKRFNGITLVTKNNANLQEDNSYLFNGLIGKCFLQHLDIYIDSIDNNLSDLIERFVQDERQILTTINNDSTITTNETSSIILPSCPDLFVFYKKSMIQCTQLDNGKCLLNLTKTFQKYLNLYCERLLQHNLPKIEQLLQSNNSVVTNLLQTKDIIIQQKQKITTSGLIQNFSLLLKDTDYIRFNKIELIRICCILTTSEYCLDTTQQLSDKLKEKILPNFSDQIDLTKEQDNFHKVISNCIQLLVQDLENACEPALTAMSKIQWQNVDRVGDQSPYITLIQTNIKTTIPIIRDNLSTSRKYFTQFCIKFVNSFIPKFIQNIYKCKPINTEEGIEQLLLDTHMLKTILLNLPSILSKINRQGPNSYTKIVIKGMTKAEMLLKIVMIKIEPIKQFIEQSKKLLPELNLNEFIKILDMKNVKRQEQAILIDAFKTYK